MQADRAGDDSLNHKPMPPVSSQFGSNQASFDGGSSMAAPFVGHPTVEANSLPDNDMPWEQDDGDEEGVVEPVFEADVSETEAALAALSRNKQDEFPLDAFIIPQDSQRLPSGVDSGASDEPVHTPVTDLADRLEKLSHRLRIEESHSILSRLASGDRLDAMLAGLLGGYLASHK
ncbi:MAG TPA: hypothetical protein VM100_09500 [Longimicrobiales bacterium]|nr:hypothetical protein [Longimicrobiales bacterium]